MTGFLCSEGPRDSLTCWQMSCDEADLTDRQELKIQLRQKIKAVVKSKCNRHKKITPQAKNIVEVIYLIWPAIVSVCSLVTQNDVVQEKKKKNVFN